MTDRIPVDTTLFDGKSQEKGDVRRPLTIQLRALNAHNVKKGHTLHITLFGVMLRFVINLSLFQGSTQLPGEFRVGVEIGEKRRFQ
jgi:hypothetical protein